MKLSEQLALVAPVDDATKEQQAFLSQDINALTFQRDSRLLSKGDVFVACPGATPTSKHGIAFLDRANAGGIRYLIFDASAYAVMANLVEWLKEREVTGVEVKSAREAWGQLVHAKWGNPSEKLNLVGVTGTNGKTTTTYFCTRYMQLLGLPTASIGTLGCGAPGQYQSTGMTTPESEVIAEELSGMSNHRNENRMDTADLKPLVAIEVSSIAVSTERIAGSRFAAGIFTNFGRDHLDFHGTMDAYWAAKERFFTTYLSDGQTPWVICIDDDAGRALAEKGRALGQDIYTIGFSDDADVRIERHFARMTLKSVHPAFTWCDGLSCEPSVVGDYNWTNLVSALVTMGRLGYDRNRLCEVTERVEAPPGRLQLVELAQASPKVFVDYAHTPDAIEAMLEATMTHFGDAYQYTIVFGCGGDRDKQKRPEMARAAERANHIIVTNDNPRSEDPEQIWQDICLGFSESRRDEVIWEPDRAAAIEKAIRHSNAPDKHIIVIAGKGHETEQDIGGVKSHFSDVEVIQSISMV